MKTAVVTGGASGIGLEFVKLLIKDDYKVFIVDNNKENLSELNNIISKNKFQSIRLDLAKRKSPKKIYKKFKPASAQISLLNLP